jgi:transcriptional regulator GlxA family with amidase domain
MRIAVLAYPGCMGTQVFAISDLLGMAGHMAQALQPGGDVPYALQVVGLRARTVTMAGGISVAVQRPGSGCDLLVVPGMDISSLSAWSDKLEPLGRELAYIRKTFAQGTPVAAVCVGSFLLAEAGLLDGRKATTAWLCAQQFASRYPGTELSADAVLVEDGAVTTTGAVSSAFDLAIHLVKKLWGARVATATARVALVSAQRASQAPFVDPGLLAPSLPAFSQAVAQWLGTRLAQPYDLERLANAFHVSARTLLRRVKSETGNSPLALMQQARVEKAKQLLTGTTWSIARITEAVGYADVPSFSRLFASRVGETPARYRRR